MSDQSSKKSNRSPVGRPRVPETPHIPPTGSERASGSVARCKGTCGLEWGFKSLTSGRCPNCLRGWYRERAYEWRARQIPGFNRKMLEEALESQDNKCAVCSVEFDAATVERRPQMDRDPGTGYFRAMLCRRCGFTVTWGQNDPDRLRKAADYVEDQAERSARMPPPSKALSTNMSQGRKSSEFYVTDAGESIPMKELTRRMTDDPELSAEVDRKLMEQIRGR